MTNGYCLKCKKKNMPMKDEKEKTMKNGRKGVQGKCKKCETNMFKITAGNTKVKGGSALSPALVSGGGLKPLNPAPLSGGGLKPLTPTPLSGGKSRRKRRKASRKNKSRKNRTRKSRR